jgi:D-alanine-D-alanine ligase
MKYCILYDSYAKSNSPLKDVDLPGDPAPYLEEGAEVEHHVIHKATAVKQIIELAKQNFDVFINVCDGAWDEDRPGIEVVQAMERLGLAFTGADSNFYEPSREKMKMVCHYWGIKTPAYVFAQTEQDIELAARDLRYPMIVKHASSYSSIGMTRDSRVTTPEALRFQARKMIDAFGAALIEEFIEGREFTALVAENVDDPQNPIAYTPIEFCFPEGETFKHFDMKWVNCHDMMGVPVSDPDISRRLQELTKRLFVGLGGTGYGRTDVRMDAAGDLYLLEINPNCGMFYPPDEAGSADLCLLNDPAGHKGFMKAIVRAALKRKHERERKWKLALNYRSQYGMYATRLIQPGEVIVPFEEQAHVLVTKTHVFENWGEPKRSWFPAYAYPLTDEVYVMWSDEPEDWKPLNHSCDPNAWLQGLDMVARRPIQAGEQITVDYATFCNEMMKDFECNCGVDLCRGTVRGMDYLEPFVERYGPHISDYVRRKRAEVATYVYLNGAHQSQPVME